MLSTSSPNFTEFPDGSRPLLPGLQRVDSSMAKVECKSCSHFCLQPSVTGPKVASAVRIFLLGE